ncbi:DUF4296 domain-containing protein [Pollutibacter soli]|uniref:DUF4296 domain-containing protein n=1 Tax=Pollutibacter soli TaxID=3034157 RepID=UPI003013B470
MFISLIIIFSLAASCRREERVPDDVISQEKMGQIFIDLAMAEAFVENFSPKDSTVAKDSLIQIEMDKILAIHKVDQTQFEASYNFYKLHPTLFKQLADSAYSKTQKSRDTSLLRRIPVKL